MIDKDEMAANMTNENNRNKTQITEDERILYSLLKLFMYMWCDRNKSKWRAYIVGVLTNYEQYFNEYTQNKHGTTSIWFVFVILAFLTQIIRFNTVYFYSPCSVKIST